MLAHELLIHGMELANISKSLKTKNRGTPSYDNEYGCMIFEPIHHGKMAEGKTPEYVNTINEMN